MAKVLQVLLVQPDAKSAESICAQFSADATYTLQVLTAASLQTAVARLQEQSFDAVLLDLDLPDADALDAFITLHLRAPAVPILVFAEQYAEERALAALRAGAEDFLTRAQIETALRAPLLFALERSALQRASHTHTAQLQFSEARFRLLINENADAIVVVNSTGIVRFANPAAARLFRTPREKLVGTLFATSLEDDGKTLQLTQGDNAVTVQLRVTETLWNGENVFLATLRDVTEQQRIADALRASQERYREFITASSEGIWWDELRPPLDLNLPEERQLDAIFYDCFLAECNDAMAQMYGFESASEIVGRATDVTVPPEDPINRELYLHFIRNGYRLTNGISHERDRLGNPKIFQNNMYGIVRDHFLVGMWGTQRDVTAQEHAREGLLRAQQAEQHQRELAEALADCAAVLNSTLHFDAVLDRILENVGRVVPHDAASIFLLQQGIARFVRGKGFTERGLQQGMEQLLLRVQEIPGYQKMVDTGEPLLISNTATNEMWMDLTGGWIQSYVGVPLRVQNKTIGFLNLDSATPDFFDARSAADLTAFAAHAATALENARLHTAEQTRADDFAALYELTRELAIQRDLDTLLETVVERAMRLLNASCGNLALFVTETQTLEPRVMKGTPHRSDLDPIKLGEGLVGRVGLTRAPIILQDYREWEFRSAQFAHSQVSAALSAPMLFSGELVGVLTVHEWGDTTRHFTAEDAQLLLLLATQAAAFVYNARLHAETEKRVQQLGLLYDAGLALNSVLEPKAQLDFLTQIAMRSVHADLAVFFRHNEAKRELVVEFSLGFGKEKPYVYLEQVPLDAEQGIEAWVARTRVPVTLNDAHRDPRFFPSGDALLSGIWVPIEHDNQLLGVLAVGASQRNAFTPQDERLLLLFASQAAVAMENTRLYQNALQANERRAVLHWASQEIIAAGLDAERVYAAIHQAASRLMACEAFVIAVLDETEEWIELPYLYDRGGRQPAGKIPKTLGLSGHMLANGTALLVNNLAASDLEVINFGHPVQVVSVLAVPLRHGGRVFGMLSAQAYSEGAYTPDDRVMLEMLAAHAAAALMNVRGAETMLQELDKAYLETALALAKTIDMRDAYTGAHSDRIAEMTDALARKMDLSDEDIAALRLGARLHDIGKIGVPDEILRKPGPLTETEWVLMKRHPEIGAEILALVRPLHKVIPVVKHHQEWYDGTGYPDGLSGDAIPLGARILAVVDAFSAMTDDRAYRKGRSVKEALAELQDCAGTQFDPDVVAAFSEIWNGH